MPNDTYVGQQWAIKNTGNNIPGGYNGVAGCDMDVDSAWNITLGSDKVIVSFLDSGVDTLHEDLADNLVLGYNFYNNNPNVFDDLGHGTAVAGIIAAVGNNNKGISGIAPLSKIMPIKIFNSAQIVDTIAIKNGITYSWKHGQSISSNSWAVPFKSSIYQAISDGVDSGRNGKGTIFIFGTANSNNDTISFPSNHPDVIAVGGITPLNTRKSETSNYGTGYPGSNYGAGLHVMAPSVAIYTTDVTGSGGYDLTRYFNNFRGTSSACPNVAGVVALMLAVDSTMRWDTVRSIICRTAEKVGGYNYNQLGPLSNLGYTWNPEMGYGKVNAYYALKEVIKRRNIYVKVIPEGFYSTGTDKLNTKDTVRAYLRNNTSPYTIIDSATTLLDSITFIATFNFNVPDNSYYLVVKHRNSIETWSADPINIASVYSNYSFISDASQAYGDNLVQVDNSPLYGIYSGDINQDGSINNNDVIVAHNDATNFVTGYINSDVTGDKIVDMPDIITTFSNSLNFVSIKNP